MTTAGDGVSAEASHAYGPPWPVPDGWLVAWRERVEFDTPLGAGVPFLSGWIVGRRACSPTGAATDPVCSQIVGWRLDVDEPAWALAPCPAHVGEARLVVDAIQTMAGQGEPIVGLAARLLEEAIAS